MFLHICEGRYVAEYKIDVLFCDDRRGIANLEEALRGPMFEPLRHRPAFAQLTVDPELQTVAWPNGADLAPEYLYFLAFRSDPELQERFREWGYLVGAEA